jgi:MFS family permease
MRAIPLRIWLVVLAGSAILLLALGTRSSYGVFIRPMTLDLGWSREFFALVIGIQNIIWGLAQPIVGGLSDRFGPRRTLAVAGLIYAGGIWLSAASTSQIAFTWGTGFMVGMGLAGLGFSVVLPAVARMVSAEQRSFVMGIGTAFTSLGQFIMVPLGQGFIQAYGWPIALAVIGAMVATSVLLAQALPARTPDAGGHQQSLGSALREAGGHSGFLLLTAGYFVCGFHVTFVGIHLTPFLADQGVPPELQAWPLALIGLANVFGCLLAGPFGLLWLSTVPLTTSLVSRIFGLTHLGTLSGIAFLGHQVGAILGVWLGGAVFDATGSYDLVWWACIGLGLLAAALNAPIDDRTIRREERKAAERTAVA